MMTDETDQRRIAPKFTGYIIGLNHGNPVQADPTTHTGIPTNTDHVATYTVPSPGELRGIPAVGRHAGAGAINETIPGWNLDDWPTPEVAA